MKAKVEKQSDAIIVSMEGKLSYEIQKPFREKLENLIQEANTDKTPKKIIFNMEELEFVGSSGISSFIQTLKEFNAKAASRPRYCHVSSEFRKMIEAFDQEEAFEFFEDEEQAKTHQGRKRQLDQ